MSSSPDPMLSRHARRCRRALGVAVVFEPELSPRALEAADAPVRRAAESTSGRRALARLLRRLGKGNAVTARRMAMPARRFSLSHSAGRAVAAGTLGPVLGLGVDYEAWRTMKRASARFFLRPGECQRFGLEDEAQLLRLWCIKEALFKADKGGQRGWLGRYWLTAQSLGEGTAIAQDGRRARFFRYTSTAGDAGVIATAVQLP